MHSPFSTLTSLARAHEGHDEGAPEEENTQEHNRDGLSARTAELEAGTDHY